MAERVIVVGGGTMGTGIALVAAKAGYEVDVVEPLESAHDRARAQVAREADRSSDTSFTQHIAWSTALPSSSDAVLAIEAVTERFDVKRDVFAALGKVLPGTALLATNTSSLSVGELAETVIKPERFLGLHFFNPPVKMQLVEVVWGSQTTPDTLERAFAIVERLGKHAVLTADTPGFIVNRVARPYYLQALRALEQSAASVEELDALARAAGFRMGPFELMDLIGLDVNLATSESIYERTRAARLEPVPLQRQMVAQGRLGRKTGVGFYSYADGRAARFEFGEFEDAEEPNQEEVVAVLGFDARAQQLADLLAERYAHVQRVESDELLDEIAPETTIVIDAGNGVDDRGEILAALDASFGAECVLFADAYATDLRAAARRLAHPQRLVGFGVLGSFEEQNAVEIVDSESVSDDALELAQELFGSLRKGVVLVEDVPGLFLGRTVGSIINEAMIAVAEEIADPEDVDTAMQLGANYPRGPIEWGREIGGSRIRRILKRLADAQGEAFAPHRSLWLLDVEESAQPQEDQEPQESPR